MIFLDAFLDMTYQLLRSLGYDDEQSAEAVSWLLVLMLLGAVYIVIKVLQYDQ